MPASVPADEGTYAVVMDSDAFVLDQYAASPTSFDRLGELFHKRLEARDPQTRAHDQPMPASVPADEGTYAVVMDSDAFVRRMLDGWKRTPYLIFFCVENISPRVFC
jgi:hypothetical protein